MTVAELIAKLQELPQDMEVCCTDDEYGPVLVDDVYVGKYYPFMGDTREAVVIR